MESPGFSPFFTEKIVVRRARRQKNAGRTKNVPDGKIRRELALNVMLSCHLRLFLLEVNRAVKGGAACGVGAGSRIRE